MNQIDPLLGDQTRQASDRAWRLKRVAARHRQCRVTGTGFGGGGPVDLFRACDDGAPAGGAERARDVERAALDTTAAGKPRQDLKDRWHDDRSGSG